ncbi:MAG: N-acetyl-gamma-glutamyl-phosphate reductase [Ilumatobacteraceae bacterium]|nr:N-acetyl-gamma-glutamyl-phosphate reductase [Ilumatobacteraceae bacterium]
MQMTAKAVGVVGASGYTGAELLRLLDAHAMLSLEAVTAASMAGRQIADVYPSLGVAYGDRTFEAGLIDDDPTALAERLDGLDAVFLGLPHEAAMHLVPHLMDRVGHIVDLSAAFRLKDATAYPEFYGFEHTETDLLAGAVYGLPELHRKELLGAQLIATPGCHVTAATLALAPLVHAGVVEPRGLIVDSMTGITGAGRAPTDTNIFANIDANTVAYGLHHHRHTPEMEQEIGGRVLFTPHLVPMSRGLLATCHAPAADTDVRHADDIEAAITAAYRDAYADEPFVAVVDGPPSTKACLGANTALVSASYDARTGSVIAMAALDNLTKGASGGALQALNVALGVEETAGLPTIGLQP